jgi:hypothetical protein
MRKVFILSTYNACSAPASLPTSSRFCFPSLSRPWKSTPSTDLEAMSQHLLLPATLGLPALHNHVARSTSAWPERLWKVEGCLDSLLPPVSLNYPEAPLSSDGSPPLPHGPKMGNREQEEVEDRVRCPLTIGLWGCPMENIGDVGRSPFITTPLCHRP